jgi:hypothetical protein
MPCIVTTVNVRRLDWAGHPERMSDGGTVKKVYVWKQGGRRKAGRPKLSWLDCIENDLKSMVPRDGRRKQNTSVWAIILKEALVKL